MSRKQFYASKDYSAAQTNATVQTAPGAKATLVIESIVLSNGGVAEGQLTIASQPLGVKATGILTFTGQPANTETVTIGSKVYTFQTSLTDSDGNVLIGATASDSLDNLIAAINLAAGAGSTYATSTTANVDVTALAGAGDTMDVTAIDEGTPDNSTVSTETVSNGSWGDTTLGGGVDGTVVIGSKTYTFQVTLTDSDGNVLIGASASDSLDNLIAAINLGAGSGTKYAASMTVNADVTAHPGPGDTMDVIAKNSARVDNLTATTETLTNGSWGAVTLEGGSEPGNVTLLDGSGGSVLFEVYLPVNGSVALSSLRIPLSVNTLLAVTSRTVASHAVNVGGYIQSRP